MVTMEITGITQTAPSSQVVDLTQAQMAQSAPDAMNVSMEASIRVMSMAQNAFEAAAAELIDAMAAVTGVGTNLDTRA